VWNPFQCHVKVYDATTAWAGCFHVDRCRTQTISILAAQPNAFRHRDAAAAGTFFRLRVDCRRGHRLTDQGQLTLLNSSATSRNSSATSAALSLMASATASMTSMRRPTCLGREPRMNRGGRRRT